jgi:hypothetical protein
MLNSFKQLFLLLLLSAVPLAAQDQGKEYVTIYEDFDEGQFGRSEYRGVLRSIKLDILKKTDSFDITLPESPETRGSWLTAVVLSADTAEKIRVGVIPLNREIIKLTETGTEIIVYLFESGGIRIRFSLERTPEAMLEMIRKHYIDDLKWKDPVLNHYKQNWVIRIHTAENVFDPWNEEITYSDALISATLIGDRNQWLWGIHDGNDMILRFMEVSGNKAIAPPPVFED